MCGGDRQPACVVCGQTESDGAEFRERDRGRCVDCTRTYYREAMRRMRQTDREGSAGRGARKAMFVSHAARDDRLASACDDLIMRGRLRRSAAFWRLLADGEQAGE